MIHIRMIENQIEGDATWIQEKTPEVPRVTVAFSDHTSIR